MKFKVVKNKSKSLFSTGKVKLLPVIKSHRGKYQELTQSVDNWEIVVTPEYSPEDKRDLNKYVRGSVTPLCFNIEFQDMTLEDVVALGELMVKTYKPFLKSNNKKKKTTPVKKTKVVKSKKTTKVKKGTK